MDSSESVRFDLADGTRVVVESGDVRRVYEDLWKLSNFPGAVSTAELLLDAAGQQPYNRRRIGLTGPQSTALRSAMNRSKPTDVA